MKVLGYHIIFLFTFLFLAVSCTGQNRATVLDLVNPFIGTGGHGHTFPGATLPFGMMQLSPDTRLEGWDGCSGYHYSDHQVYGFSHTHLSGTGVSDYGDLLLMPFSSDIQFHNGADGRAGYVSRIDKSEETASPGYYKTLLVKDSIVAELTSATRSGMHLYTFPQGADKKLIIDLAHRDQVIESHLEIINEREVVGYRHSDNWARDQKFFFVIQFEEPILESTIELNSTITEKKSVTGEAIKAALEFGTHKAEMKIRVGISAVDIDGARNNLDAEINHWEFDKVRAAAEDTWAQALGKIQIKDEDFDKKMIFYTALYHTMIAPNIYSDVDGRYRSTDLKIHKTEDHDQYTVFSLWDTYRATHPLYTLIEQERTVDFIKTFLNQYEQGGQLPMWELAGNYTGCMIGYHATPVIADAYLKGITDFDTELALKAMTRSAEADKLGISTYAASGLLTTADEAESVSKTLEYAYDDWTIARMAEKMGHNDISDDYYARAQNYKNVFDPETKFMRARTNNRWFYPFKPEEVNFNYTEANAWQYSYYVPQDVSGWVNLMGGEVEAEQKLDALFSAPSATSGRNQADITGLIGQYAHGNEPSHHIAYLYNYIGKPHKTQQYVRRIMEELYHNAPDGLSGNEDCGQMSAWLVMSALGFYPVAPGSNEYQIGSPWFDYTQIELENGNHLIIETESNSKDNIYIQDFSISGQPSSRSTISHKLLMEGPYLHFKMGPEPGINFGIKPEDRPQSSINTQEVVAIPALTSGDRSFIQSTQLALSCATPDATIYYTLNDSKPKKYKKPIKIKDKAQLVTWAEKEGALPSAKATSYFTKMDDKKKLVLRSTYASQYAAGGHLALIDQVRGGNDYRNSVWQGYEGQDIEAIVDLGEMTDVSELRMGFLQDENSWIFMPTQLEVWVGQNGQWEHFGTLNNDVIATTDTGAITKDFVIKGKAKGKYVKVIATSLRYCPDHHKGAGNPCWLFADEIVVK